MIIRVIFSFLCAITVGSAFEIKITGIEALNKSNIFGAGF